MSITYDFTGRVALITGATGAIGGAVYQALVAAGCAHVAGPTRKDLDLSPDNNVMVSLDFIENLCRVKGRLDIVVACHASPPMSYPGQALWIDLFGTSEMLLESIMPMMRDQQFGRVVLMSSIRARWPRAGQAMYAASKNGIEGLCRALAVEYGQYGITVNCIAPGALISLRTTQNIEAGVVSEAELLARTPAGRLATPEDVANAVLWLCSDGAEMVNGQVLYVDGGWSVAG